MRYIAFILLAILSCGSVIAGQGMYPIPIAYQSSCIPTESPEVSCSDTLDNDCDGLVDVDDSDCGSHVDDNFDRADGSLGSNWATVGSFAPTISSGTVTSSITQLARAKYIGATFSSNQKVCAKITALGDSIGVEARTQSGTNSCYYLVTKPTATNGELRRRDGGSSVLLETLTPISVGDTVCLVANGSSIYATKNGSAWGTGVSDTNYTGGTPGIVLYYSTGFKGYLDDFSADDM